MMKSRDMLALEAAVTSREGDVAAAAEKVASLVEKAPKLEKAGSFEKLVVVERELVHARAELARAESAAVEAEGELAQGRRRDEQAEAAAQRAQLVERGKALEPGIVDVLEQYDRLVGLRMAIDDLSGESRLDLRALAEEATLRVTGGRTPSSAWECRQLPGVLLFAPGRLEEYDAPAGSKK